MDMAESGQRRAERGRRATACRHSNDMLPPRDGAIWERTQPLVARRRASLIGPHQTD
jgi:hypothetical protein